MNGKYHHRDTCRLCESREVELVLPIKPSALADSYLPKERLHESAERFPMDVYLCRHCGHVQLLDVVNPEILFSNYLYITSSSLGLVEHFRRYADAVLAQLNPPAGSLVMDIGSNEGALLKFFKERGMKVLGVDAAKNVAALANRNGIETIADFFSRDLAAKIVKSHGQAKIITANNVFAHADQLGGMLDGIHDLLAPDGVFVFEVVYLVDLVEKYTFDTIYHEHLSHHSVKPFQAFCRRHGMELFHVERIPSKGGSIRGFVQLAGGARPVSPAVKELVALEEKLGLDQPAAFQQYAARLEVQKQELLTLLRRLKKEGKRIGGYGASASVTTLLHHFELGDLVEFIIDDNPSRQNVFSPGFHLPCVSSAVLAEWKPDYVVILAWQYAGPIIQKNTAYLQQGGHFILPLPEVKVV